MGVVPTVQRANAALYAMQSALGLDVRNDAAGSPHNLEGNIDARTGGTEQIIAMGTVEWTVIRVEGRIVRIMRWLKRERGRPQHGFWAFGELRWPVVARRSARMGRLITVKTTEVLRAEERARDLTGIRAAALPVSKARSPPRLRLRLPITRHVRSMSAFPVSCAQSNSNCH